MDRQKQRRYLQLVVICIVAALIGARFGARFGWMPASSEQASSSMAGVQIGGPFKLIDQNGKTVTEKSFPGKYKLIYFGFTSCPMICPTTLANITKALNALGRDADKIQPIFITVDPERDTKSVLKDYLKPFYPGFVGLTGKKSQIDAVEKNFRVYAAKQEDGDDYTMAHSGFTYFMSPEGNLLAIYRDEDSGDSIAKDIKGRLK